MKMNGTLAKRMIALVLTMALVFGTVDLVPGSFAIADSLPLATPTDLMPLEEFADKFTDRKDRDAFFRVLDLLEESFSLLDELLGPAEEWEDSEETVEEVVEHRLEAKGRKVTAKLA